MHSEIRKAQKLMQEGGLGIALASTPADAPHAPRPMSERVTQISLPSAEDVLPRGQAALPASQGPLPVPIGLDSGPAMLQGTKQGRAPRITLAPTSGANPLPMGHLSSTPPPGMSTGMQQQEGSGVAITQQQQQQQQRLPRRVPIVHPAGISRQPRDPSSISVTEGCAPKGQAMPAPTHPQTIGNSSTSAGFLDFGLPPPRQPGPARVLLTITPPSQGGMDPGRTQGGMSIAPPSLPLPAGPVHAPRERQQLPLAGISRSGMPASLGGVPKAEVPHSTSRPRSPVLYEPVDRPPYEGRPRERDSRVMGAEMGSRRGSGGGAGHLDYGEPRRNPADVSEGRPAGGSGAWGGEGRPTSGGNGRGRERDSLPPPSSGPNDGRRDYYTEGSRARDAGHGEGMRHSPIPTGNGGSGRGEGGYKRMRYEDRSNDDRSQYEERAQDGSKQYERRR